MSQLKPILITGGLGYVGSRLIERMCEKAPKQEVFVIDRKSIKTCPFNQFLKENRNVILIPKDIFSADLGQLISESSCVIHLAASVYPEKSIEDEAATFRNNAAGTRLVAEACANTNTPIIFPSTTSLYGFTGADLNEETPQELLRPHTPYAKSKLEAEKTLHALGNSQGLQFLIFRWATIFGPSPVMNYYTAVNRFCKEAYEQKTVTLWKTALTQTRPYLDLEDAIASIFFALKHKLFLNTIFNVSTCHLTAYEIAHKINEAIPVEIRTNTSPAMSDSSYNVSNDRLLFHRFIYRGNIDRGIRRVLSRCESDHQHSSGTSAKKSH